MCIRDRAISHDIHFIKSICDSVHVLKEGEILESGPLKKIIDNPYHDYTKSLVSQWIFYFIVKKNLYHIIVGK